MKLIIVSPCYNEQECLYSSADTLTAIIKDLISKKKINSDSFILFVNDGSSDNTWYIIEKLAIKNSYIKGINIKYNKGQQSAIYEGIISVKNSCDAIITIDADLQDDLLAIEKMVDKYYEGYDVIYGVKTTRKCDSIPKRVSASLFYLIQKLFGLKVIYNHSDFRLISNKVALKISNIDSKYIYLRGLIPLLGYKSTTVEDVISERKFGKTKYTVKKMIKLAISSIYLSLNKSLFIKK